MLIVQDATYGGEKKEGGGGDDLSPMYSVFVSASCKLLNKDILAKINL